MFEKHCLQADCPAAYTCKKVPCSAFALRYYTRPGHAERLFFQPAQVVSASHSLHLVQLVTYWQTQWLQAAVIGAVLILCALPTAQLADTQGCNQLWPFTLQRLLHLLHTCGELLLQTVMHRQIWWQQAAVNESMLKFCNLLLQVVKHWQTWWPPLR